MRQTHQCLFQIVHNTPNIPDISSTHPHLANPLPASPIHSLPQLCFTSYQSQIPSSYYNSDFQMATTFGGSRLANLREKRTSGEEAFTKNPEPLKLGLPADETDKVAYEPTATGGFGRSQTRLLRGRIDRTSHEQDIKVPNENGFEKTGDNFKPKLTISQGNTEQLRLVLNDDPKVDERKPSIESNPLRTTQKRILIAKEVQKEKVEEKVVESAQPVVIVPDAVPEKPVVQLEATEKPIREEDVEQSMQAGSENDLLECPEGCGRKFNRKALEKHAKACKLVFMSKRKEFNSEAKRLVNKEQANIAKQVKAKEKKEGKGKAKDMGKTGDNWKAASEDFRAAVKAFKKEVEEEPDKEDDDQKEEEEMKILPCKFCEKPFAEVFLEKHMDNCVMKKKQVEKKKTLKKK